MTIRLVLGATAAAAALAAIGGVVLAAGTLPAAPMMTYSGVMRDESGTPLSGANKIVQVKLWRGAETTGDELCKTDPTAVRTDGAGHFSLPLADECVDAIKSHSDAYVEVIVDTESLGTTKLGAVPYAVEATHAAEAAHAAAADNASSAKAVSSTAFRISNDCVYTPGVTTDCTCAEDEVAIGGGACASGSCVPGAWLGESMKFPDRPRVWRVSCANAAGDRVECYAPFAFCIKASQ